MHTCTSIWSYQTLNTVFLGMESQQRGSNREDRDGTKTCTIHSQPFREHQQRIIDARSPQMRITEVKNNKNPTYSLLQSGTQPDRHTSRQIFDTLNNKDKISAFEEIQTVLYRFIQI